MLCDLRPLWLLLALACAVAAQGNSTIVHPEIDFDDIGGKLGVLGSFDSLAFYTSLNDSSFLESAGNSTLRNHAASAASSNLFLRDTLNNNSRKIASTNGQISSIEPLSDTTVLVNGNFTQLNGQQCQAPVIYNISSQELTSIFQSQSSSKRDDLPQLQSGSVITTYVDGDLIYLGGDFEFNNTFGAAIYNTSSKSVTSTPFGGFGANAVINAIAKVFDDNASNSNQGSIIFGGNFTTLGLSDLLMHNITSNSTRSNSSNSTNTTIVEAEQQVSLRHGIFSNVNGQGDEASIVCPKQSTAWKVAPGEGGQWAVELPAQMKGLVPTKARIYIPEGEDTVNLFRIYSFPNNGIMNLSYVDPDTNELAFCDAWCPLATLKQLEESTANNIDDIDVLNADDVFIDEKNGAFSMYYSPSAKTKTLSYGTNYQEFSFIDSIPIDRIALTVVSWYGSQGSLAGFELYQDSLTVYGNATLNEPNCPGDNADNSVDLGSDNWKSVHEVSNAAGVQDTDYLVSVGDPNGKVVLYPNVTYSGDYSIIMMTPGCIGDDSCAKRSVVNVSVIDSQDQVIASHTIYQNNDYNKFDYLFFGHLNGSTEVDGRNRVEMSFVSPVVDGTENPWVVLDKIRLDIVSLDSYYDRNSTNSTARRNSTSSELTELKLHGLFEYSLANFTDFDPTLVSNEEDGDKLILKTNTFVGNSSINLLSNDLGNGSVVNQLSYQTSGDQRLLVVLGDLNSAHVSTSGDAISLKIDSYNQTANSTVANLARRTLQKREQSTFLGAEFDDSIASIVDYGNSLVILGKWTMSGNETVKISNLAENNASTTSASNFVIHSDGEFYSFGNSLIEATFNQFTNISIDDVEYFVFSASDGTKRTWDNTNHQFVEGVRELSISQAFSISQNQQIISGSTFNLMNAFINDLAYTDNNKNFTAFNVNITNSNSSVLTSFFVNDSLSIVGGRFTSSNDVVNVGILDTSGRNSFRELQGGIEWGNDSAVQALYVDNNGDLLVIGTNGSSTIGGEAMVSGLLIYGLQNNTFTNFQPAALINNNGDMRVNSIVSYESSRQLVAGGAFTNAGSLDCPALCIYDIDNTRWITPDSASSLSGSVTDIKFYTNNGILISGDLSFNDTTAGFVTYDLQQGTFSAVSFGSSRRAVQGFVFCDAENANLDGHLIAYGDDFLSGYDGELWRDIEGIMFSDETQISDIKLLTLEESNDDNNGTFFSSHKVLAVSGRINLQEFGWVNVALFNGTGWIPYMYTSTENAELGMVYDLLVEDQYRFQSQDDIKNSRSQLSSGKVVGISLACALGTTTLLSMLFVIPYFAFFRRRTEGGERERINEKDMVGVVNPADLLHEIDLQRNH